LDDSDYDALWKELDVNSDGQISLDEFLAKLEK